MANSVVLGSLVCVLCCCIPLLAFPVEETDGLIGRLIERLKRSSTTELCSPNSSLNTQNVNLSDTQFLGTAEGGIAYNFPENGDHPWNETNVTAPGNSTVRGTPICPFDFKPMTLPRGYKPASVNHAFCRNQLCGGNNCQLVFSTVNVLRPNGCRNGMQLYQIHPLTLPTSCACVNFKN